MTFRTPLVATVAVAGFSLATSPGLYYLSISLFDVVVPSPFHALAHVTIVR